MLLVPYLLITHTHTRTRTHTHTHTHARTHTHTHTHTDEGGLMLLVPYLLSQSQRWRDVRLRVLTLAAKKELSKEEIRMSKVCMYVCVCVCV